MINTTSFSKLSTVLILTLLFLFSASCGGKSTSGDATGEQDTTVPDGTDTEEESDASPDTDSEPDAIDDPDAAEIIPEVVPDPLEDPVPDLSDAVDMDEEEEWVLTVSECFADKADPELSGPEYDRFHPVVGSHCLGTNHQDIDGIEKVVYLGDSITVGTPPTPFLHYYRNQLSARLKDKFGDHVEVSSCAAWGARTDDLLLPSNQQILNCFDPPEPKRTLVVMTVGGNDFSAMAQDAGDGKPMDEIMLMAESTVVLLRDAVEWFFVEDRFPAGVFVIFSNIYEFTDGTGDLNSCLIAPFAGLGGEWPEGREPAIYVNEEYMRLAVDTQTDMIFMLEHFCGHGFHNDDPESQCYCAGERWLDFTCIHPNRTGHDVITDMFMAVVNE